MDLDLTTQMFWENYWSTLKLPVEVDLNFKNDRVIATEIIKLKEDCTGKSALEIGCAPGKWLSFMAKSFGCRVTGIEYVQSAATRTIENLKLQNIENYQIINGDFFNHNLLSTFDIVISLGFVEHFSYYEKVLEDQLKLVSPNGYLIVGIPRFKGINYFLQKGIDFFIQNKLIPSHHLEIMNLEVFNSFSKNHNIEVITNKFVGGFEPGLFPVGEIKNIFPRVFFKILLRFLDTLFGKVDSAITSSYQITILKK